MPLPPEIFKGAGIYALYYLNGFGPYRRLVEINKEDQWRMPIYIGEAVPAGSRKGGFGLGENPGTVLWRRLTEHSKSISCARNLSLADFRCRYLVVEDIWIPLGESLLIQTFNPLWNKMLDGFGNHDPGKGRYKQAKSPWDTVHPGRPWAERLDPASKTADQLMQEIEKYLSFTCK